MLADYGDDLSRPRHREVAPAASQEISSLRAAGLARVAGLAVAAGLLALAASGLAPSTPDVTVTASARVQPVR